MGSCPAEEWCLYDVHRDDLSELLKRDSRAKIIPANPAPEPWTVIAERVSEKHPPSDFQ
jgi:hypothetical protein